MHENRTRYPKKKTAMYQQLQEIPKKYRVLAIIKMNKVRSTQILPLRKTLKGQAEFVSIKDKIAKKVFGALPDVPGIKEMAAEFEGQCMCIFTNMSPFKLNVLLAKNKIMMAARRRRCCKCGYRSSCKKYRNCTRTHADRVQGGRDTYKD